MGAVMSWLKKISRVQSSIPVLHLLHFSQGMFEVVQSQLGMTCGSPQPSTHTPSCPPKNSRLGIVWTYPTREISKTQNRRRFSQNFPDIKRGIQLLLCPQKHRGRYFVPNSWVCSLLCGLVLAISAGCGSSTSEVSEEITRQFQASGRTFVNLAEVLPSSWDKVCILGPYSDNSAAKKVLGFPWDVETQSSIATKDDIGLLLFVKDTQVVEHVEHARRDGDFTNLSRRCFQRDHSTFYHQTNPQKGWPGLFPKT